MRISDWSSDVCSSDLSWLQGQRNHGSELSMPERGERGKPELSGRVDRLSRPIGLFGYFVCLTDSFALLTQSGFEPLGFNLQLITMRSRAGDRRQSHLCLSLARRGFNISDRTRV